MPIETERSKTVNRNILPPYVRISTNQIAFQSWLTVLSDWYLLPCVCGLRLICEESVVCVVRDLGIREVMGAMAKKKGPENGTLFAVLGVFGSHSEFDTSLGISTGCRRRVAERFLPAMFDTC